MPNLHVTFRVHVAEKQYAYDGKQESAETVMELPREVLEHLDAGNIFQAILQAALINYDSVEDADDDS